MLQVRGHHEAGKSCPALRTTTHGPATSPPSAGPLRSPAREDEFLLRLPPAMRSATAATRKTLRNIRWTLYARCGGIRALYLGLLMF